MSDATRSIVLVVDDDPDQLIIRCMLLAHHGFDTRRAGDPQQALSIARSEQPYVAVLDLRLPTEELGLELIRNLKEALPTIHLIVYTGLEPASFAGKPGIELVDEVLQKGVSSEALIRSLEKIAAARAA